MAESKADKKAETQKEETAKKEDKPAPKPRTVQQDVKACYALIQESVGVLEPRFITRVLKLLPSIRKRLDVVKLKEILDSQYPPESNQKQLLFSLLPEAPAKASEMEVDDSAAPAIDGEASKEAAKPPKSITPEADIYSTLLVLVFLLDQKMIEQGLALSDHTVKRLLTMNRRSLDQLAAKIYFYYSRFHELASGVSGLVEIRSSLLSAQQTAALRHDDDSLATLLNLLLRSYYAQNLYEQADKLIAKTKFPTNALNAQLARWYYYVGRLRAIQLRYTESHNSMQQAIRRAPNAKIAPGFYQTIHKLAIVVELLMGEIPERSLFRHPVLKNSLAPYLPIARAVRIGDLSGFTAALEQGAKGFKADGTYSLIVRLRHNVIKTALRTISLAYSKIPLSLISTKLGLDSEEEAEYVVAKAIRDGVVEAGLDHEQGVMMSSEVTDVYGTAEPMRAFDERIKFCLNLRNESVKAMRYPKQAEKKDLSSVEEARQREKEAATDILEGNMDDDEDMM